MTHSLRFFHKKTRGNSCPSFFAHSSFVRVRPGVCVTSCVRACACVGPFIRGVVNCPIYADMMCFHITMIRKLIRSAGILTDWDQANATCNGWHSGASMNIMSRSADIRRPTKADPRCVYIIYTIKRCIVGLFLTTGFYYQSIHITFRDQTLGVYIVLVRHYFYSLLLLLSSSSSLFFFWVVCFSYHLRYGVCDCHLYA